MDGAQVFSLSEHGLVGSRFRLFRACSNANDFYLQFIGLFTEMLDCRLCLPISIKRSDIECR
jgi:hypothetical protein